MLRRSDLFSFYLGCGCYGVRGCFAALAFCLLGFCLPEVPRIEGNSQSGEASPHSKRVTTKSQRQGRKAERRSIAAVNNSHNQQERPAAQSVPSSASPPALPILLHIMRL